MVIQEYSSKISKCHFLQDSTVNISAIPENLQTYSSFLGQSLDIIMGVRQCPTASMTLCVTSDAELEKCIRMKVSKIFED